MWRKNAGDLYCLPLLFYKFPGYKTIYINKFNEINKFKNSIIIFGGGGILDTNKERNKYYNNLEKSNLYIHWGSGSNRLNLNKITWKINDNEKNVKDDILNNFKFIGRRDYLERCVF